MFFFFREIQNAQSGVKLTFKRGKINSSVSRLMKITCKLLPQKRSSSTTSQQYVLSPMEQPPIGCYVILSSGRRSIQLMQQQSLIVVGAMTAGLDLINCEQALIWLLISINKSLPKVVCFYYYFSPDKEHNEKKKTKWQHSVAAIPSPCFWFVGLETSLQKTRMG